MTAKSHILNILRIEGKIDNHRAIDQRLTTRLGAVIHKLGQEGKIEIDEEKSGFLPNSRNWCYVIKAPKTREIWVSGQLIKTIFI